jgi:hypothetical protein
MNDRLGVIAAAFVLALPLGGCRGVAQQHSWPVGTCARVDGRGTTAVPCSDPHTHRVIAIVASAEACPSATDMFAQPADPDDGGMTTCFRSDT